MDPVSATTLIGTGLKAVRAIVDLTGRLKDAGAKKEILDQTILLQQAINDLQLVVSQLTEQSRSLGDKLHGLEAQQDLKKKLSFRNNSYWNSDDDPPRPYCSACIETKNQTVTLKKADDCRGRCPSCGQLYDDVFGSTSAAIQKSMKEAEVRRKQQEKEYW